MIKICINCNTEKDILTKSNICKECNILKRKASHKKWRDNNKDKIKFKCKLSYRHLIVKKLSS